MSGFIASPPAPSRRLRLATSVGSRQKTGVPVGVVFSFLSLSFWAEAVSGRASIKTSKLTRQNTNLVRNMVFSTVSFWYKTDLVSVLLTRTKRQKRCQSFVYEATLIPRRVFYAIWLRTWCGRAAWGYPQFDEQLVSRAAHERHDPVFVEPSRIDEII